MSLQLRQMNFGRDKKEQDRCYLNKANQLRAQSQAFMHSAANIADLENYLLQIAVRLQESIFENAKFTKRLYHEMVSKRDIDMAQTDKDKLRIIRDTFS